MIVCAGEALIDMLPRESAAGEPAFAPYPGGAVFNTAIALGRLGAPTGFVSGVSTDLFGEMLAAALSESGVATDLLVRSDRPTTLAFVRLVDGHASYAFYDENTAGRMLAPGDLPPLPGEATALFLGGISLMVEPCADAYASLAARTGDRVLMLDPNIRPGFIANPEAYRARLEPLLARADIVKASDEDLAWLMGDGAPEALARRLLDRGVKLVCLTEGAAGARGITAHGTVHVPARKAQVVDTVGAGDTFNAGVLAALHRAGALSRAALDTLDEATLRDALDLGVRAAAVTVSRAGANPPWASEV